MPAIKYDKLANAGDFLAAGKSLTKRGVSIKADFQKALLCSLAFTEQHGDYESSILVLLDAVKVLGANLHRTAVEWVLKFSWLVEDDTSKSGFRKDKDKVMNIAGAENQMWYEKEKKPNGRAYDFQKALLDLFKNIDAEIKAERLSKEIVETSISQQLAAFDPDFVTNQVLDASPTYQNELLTILVARMTPAEEPALETAEAA